MNSIGRNVWVTRAARLNDTNCVAEVCRHFPYGSFFTHSPLQQQYFPLRAVQWPMQKKKIEQYMLMGAVMEEMNLVLLSPCTCV